MKSKTMLLYSEGLKRGTHHYTDDNEVFYDVKTLEETKKISDSCIVICGNFISAGGGDYSSSDISLYIIGDKYKDILNEYEEEKAIEMLLEFYKAEKLETSLKYPNRYSILKERL